MGMARKLLILFVALAFWSCQPSSQWQQATLTHDPSEAPSETRWELQAWQAAQAPSKGYLVTVTFPQPQLRQVTLAGEGYTVIDAAGTLPKAMPGHPLQQVWRQLFTVPAGHHLRVTVVKNIIRNAYASEAVTNTLLVGSIDQIPSYRRSGIWTDLDYTLLDGGSVPDLAMGRLPARTPEELQNMITKLIRRAEEPRNRESFLLTAGRDASLGCPANVDRIGRILEDNRSDVEITKLYRLNGATQEEIIAAYNDNPNIVVYDGHGNQDGMTEIPFLMAHLDRLTNDTYPIILDIACLNAHWPSNGAARRNFAESILAYPERGAAGIVAAGGNSGGHSFFRDMVTRTCLKNTFST